MPLKTKEGKAGEFHIGKIDLMGLCAWRGNPSFVTIESPRENGDTGVLVLIPDVGATSKQTAREILKALGHKVWKEDS